MGLRLPRLRLAWLRPPWLRPPWLRNATSRLLAAHLVLVALSTAMVLAFVYFSTRDVIEAEVREIVAATARRYGVDPSLALAVAFHESGFQQHVVSPVDAIGVMQVLPSTGRGVSKIVGRELDLLDVRDNVTAGVALLDSLLASTGSSDKALAGYYQGLGSVAKRGLLPQTEAYIRNVNALRPRFGG